MDAENKSSDKVEEQEVNEASPEENNDIPQDDNNQIINEPSETLENVLDIEIEQTVKSEAVEGLSVNLPNEISETGAETLVSHDQPENEPSECLGDIQNEILATMEKTATAEMSTTVPVILASQNQTEALQSSTAAGIVVKNEPYGEECDYGMPIAKTPRHTSAAESWQPLDNVNETPMTSDMLSASFPSKAALDEYLDGMVTPIAPPAPRLRIKPELALFKVPQCAPIEQRNDSSENGAATNAEIRDPPPPPTLSSNCNSDFVADGIATPRLSLASINRLRVKSEFSEPPATAEQDEEGPSEDFFNDLLSTNASEREDGEVSPTASDDGSDNEEIPSDYFDDLLIDKLKEKIDRAQNNEMEVKFSALQKLKDELRAVEEKKARKMRKKQKKAKKKSRKRSRSRSVSPHSRTKERSSSDSRRKHSRTSPSRPTSSIYVSRQVSEINDSRAEMETTAIKTEFSATEEGVGAIEEVLTPKQKREKAIKRGTALLHYIKYKSEDNSDTFSEFPFVSVVRKLPASHSYVQQQLHENRSPLHSVNNVNYTFNSHSSRFKMEEWGLAALSPIVAKQAKLVGCDAEFIHNKLKTINIPAKLKKSAQEATSDEENVEQEELVETASSLFANAMTQTDEVDEPVVQPKPEAYSIGIQTLDTQISPTKNEELPLMKVIQDLNENQLMAIHSFAELIKDQNTTSNAMAMYKIQMQIMDIYKMSQIPSALDAPQPSAVSSYTTTRPPEQANLCIQSVEGADGRQFTLTDPRSNSAAYAQRNAYDDPRHNHRQTYASRPSSSKTHSQTYYSSTSEPNGRYAPASPSTRHHPYNPHSSQQSPTTVTAKRYGRGASFRR